MSVYLILTVPSTAPAVAPAAIEPTVYKYIELEAMSEIVPATPELNSTSIGRRNLI